MFDSCSCKEKRLVEQKLEPVRRMMQGRPYEIGAFAENGCTQKENHLEREQGSIGMRAQGEEIR